MFANFATFATFAKFAKVANFAMFTPTPPAAPSSAARTLPAGKPTPHQQSPSPYAQGRVPAQRVAVGVRVLQRTGCPLGVVAPGEGRHR